jgi:hypothetical protein
MPWNMLVLQAEGAGGGELTSRPLLTSGGREPSFGLSFQDAMSGYLLEGSESHLGTDLSSFLVEGESSEKKSAEKETSVADGVVKSNEDDGDEDDEDSEDGEDEDGDLSKGVVKIKPKERKRILGDLASLIEPLLVNEEFPSEGADDQVALQAQAAETADDARDNAPAAIGEGAVDASPFMVLGPLSYASVGAPGQEQLVE